jgi:hypothetical protein
MKKRMSVWRIVCKSLGEKAGKNNQEADRIALIRLLMFLSIFITNSFIVYGVLRTHHFPVKSYECNLSSSLSTAEKERILTNNSRRFPYD